MDITLTASRDALKYWSISMAHHKAGFVETHNCPNLKSLLDKVSDFVGRCQEAEAIVDKANPKPPATGAVRRSTKTLEQNIQELNEVANYFVAAVADGEKWSLDERVYEMGRTIMRCAEDMQLAINYDHAKHAHGEPAWAVDMDMDEDLPF